MNPTQRQTLETLSQGSPKYISFVVLDQLVHLGLVQREEVVNGPNSWSGPGAICISITYTITPKGLKALEN